MATLTVKDIPPFDGDYSLDISAFTNREMHTIKEISGIRAGELPAAAKAADNDLVVAFTVIVLRRAGHQDVNADLIWDADVGCITITPDPQEAEERPPISASPSGNESSSGDAESASAKQTSSGSGSGNGSDLRATHLSGTGSPGSAITSPSDRMTLAS